MTNTKVYIVGKVIDHESESWEFAGVFSSIKQAELACINENYFVGPAIMNKELPFESVEWEGAYYPKSINA